MKCEICGRTEEELNEEFGLDIEVFEHQGMDKCSKCVREYESELGEENVEDSSPEPADVGDWREEITA